MIATPEQYGEFADIAAEREENARSEWDYRKPGRFIYRTAYDGETRVYMGFPDMDGFTRDLLRQSELPTVEAALEAARKLGYNDDAEWLYNAVLNQLERI